VWRSSGESKDRNDGATNGCIFAPSLLSFQNDTTMPLRATVSLPWRRSRRAGSIREFGEASAARF
jgi:hypothetical protein